MPGFSLSIKLDDAKARADIAALIKQVASPKPAMEDIARMLANRTEDAFQAQTSPFGQKWPDLREATKERRAAKGHWPGMMLQVTGGLAASVTHGADANSAWVGASKIYAAIHQFGGLPGMAPGPAHIPARPYIPVDAAGNIPEAVSADIIDILSGYLRESGILA